MTHLLAQQQEQINQQARPPPPQQPGLKFFFKEIQGSRAPTFRGTSKPEEAEIWLKVMSDHLRLLQALDDPKVEVVIPFLAGDAEKWRHNVAIRLAPPISWTQFCEEFKKFYVSDSVIL